MSSASVSATSIGTTPVGTAPASAAPRTCPAPAPAASGAPGPFRAGGADGAGPAGCAEHAGRVERPRCPAGRAAASLPRDGVERAVVLALRYVAAAAETGDAACFDAAFDGAEAAFGPRDGALLVARAAALVRALRRDADGGAAAPRFLPPPCRFLSPGETRILDLLRLRLSGGREPGFDAPGGLSLDASAALADLAAPVRSAGQPLLPAAAAPPPAARHGRGPDAPGAVARRSKR